MKNSNKYIDLINILDNTNLSNLSVTNVYTHEIITLDKSQEKIQERLDITLDKDLIENYDHEQIKKELWLEEQQCKNIMSNINYASNKNLKHFYRDLKKKYNQLNDNYGHIYNIDFNNHIIISIILALLQSKILKSGEYIITLIDFYYKLGYRVNYILNFKKLKIDMSYNDYLEKTHGNDVSIYLAKLGQYIISPFEQLNLISLNNIKKSVNGDFMFHTLDITEHFKSFIHDNYIFNPLQYPMISKPQKWYMNKDKYVNGGYYRSDLISLELIHSRKPNKHNLVITELNLNIINYLSSIEFTINDVIWKYIQFDELNELEKICYNIGKSLKDKKFYLPCYYDWRGRIYTYNTLFTYQGMDFALMLIQFNKGQILNEDGLKYFILFMGNTYNSILSKTSNNNKLNWFIKNENLILNLDEDFMNKSENKYLFITLCQLYKQYKFDPQFLIKIIIHGDATCSGIQQISGLIKDVQMGELVNINESNDYSIPNDFYAFMIQEIKEQLSQDIKLNHLDEFLPLLELDITRKLIKKPIMTIPYTSKIYGIASQLKEEALEKRIIKKEKSKKNYYVFMDKNNHELILNEKQIFYLAKIIKVTMDLKFPLFKKLYDYLHSMIDLAIQLNFPISWHAPDGMIITQYYVNTLKKHVNFQLGPLRRKLVINIPLNAINKAKSKAAISPNIIHSLDASHLQFIVEKLMIYDIQIVTIHDCFLVHPNNFKFLKTCVNSEFIRLYTNYDFLNNFHNNITKHIYTNYQITKINSNTSTFEYQGSLMTIPNLPINKIDNQIINKYINIINKANYMII